MGNNLFTGYGWGVTTKGVEDVDGVAILDRENAGSVEKFENIKTDLTNNRVYTLGQIFSFVNNGVPVKPEGLTITISNLDTKNNPVSANIEYVRDINNWINSTIEFSGTGTIQITIQDYYFCEPTTITVNIVERQPEKKFDVALNNGDFLHRVGNGNLVSLKYLFGNIEGATIGSNVEITIEEISSNLEDATITPSNVSWKDATIDFNGTGIVKVSITDNDWCTPTELYLEIVDAMNYPSATSGASLNATSNNVVLLSNTSANSLSIKNGYIFHGNGFKVDFKGNNGSYRSAAISYGFVTIDNGGIMDNTKIICDIFPESYLYTNEMKAGSDDKYPYGYSAVIITGNSTVSNSYIYGARNNIQVGEGNVTIKNTVLESGSLSNIHIRTSNSSYTVVLENITTIQYQTTSDYDTSKKIMGFGILVGTNESETNPTIKLLGTLKQYNWVNSSHGSNLSNTYAKSAINAALKVSAYQHTINSQTMVNMGIAFLNSKTATITDNRDNKTDVPYALNGININGYDGQVCSISNSELAKSYYYPNADSVEKYVSTTNRATTPIVALKSTTSTSIKFETVFENGSWVTKFSADLDNITGGTYTFKFSDLTVTKNGKDLSFLVKDSNGNTVDKNTAITLSQLTTQNYTLVVTDNQLYATDGKLTNTEITHELPFVLNATKTSIEPPKFTNAGTATAIRLVEKSGGDWRPAYTVLTGVTVTYWSASEGKVKTIDLATLYNSGTINANVWTYTCNDFTLTITGGQVHSDGSKITPVVSNNTLYFASTNKAFTTSTTSRDIILTYVFTDKNDSSSWSRTEKVQYSNLSEYDYKSFKNGSLSKPSSGTCIAEGSMITLADGSKKAVEDIRRGDWVMAFDHVSGNVVYKEVALIGKTYADFYYKSVFVFDDGTELNAINEHGIYDLDLNQYVNIGHENYLDFVGHRFVSIDSQGNIGVKRLVDVVTTIESGYKYDIVTNETLTYVVEDTLSVSHEIVMIMNSFMFGDNMTYDAYAMKADIAKYGLYTYDDFAEYCDFETFNKYNMAMMKVGVGKGIYTYEHLVHLLTDIALNDNVQIIE